MNLLKDPWIPVFRKDGITTELIRPYEITNNIEKNPVSILYAARPDFNGSLFQFLIGYIQTIMTPEDEEVWVEHYLSPPTEEKLQGLTVKYSDYFNLDGDGIRFMQEAYLDSDNTVNIGSLLIESPGANTIKNNTDHFIKRGNAEKLCSCCTAAAIFTLNTNAPAGGAGIRTSLRGGGPLTTIAVPGIVGSKYDTLWHKVWLNILIKDDLRLTHCKISLKKDEQKFPWIKPVKTSKEKGTETTFDEIHPVQTYWAMPRRMKLDPQVAESAICDICGKETNSYYSSYSTKPYGINYGEGILHPLSPYYSDKDGQKLPVHPQPGGFIYRHWPLYVASTDSNNPRAINLQRVDERLQDLKSEGVEQSIRVHVFGYDMDNMKARCWYEALMPYFLVNENICKNFVNYAQRLADAARQVASNTRIAVKNTWLSPESTVRGDLSFVESEFWNGTENDYYMSLMEIRSALEKNVESINDILWNWVHILNRKSLSIFDFYAEQVSPFAGDAKEKNEKKSIPRMIKARDRLIGFNLGKQVREKALNLPAKISSKA